MEPVSPMKIFAGLKLYRKNPTVAPASARDIHAKSVWPSCNVMAQTAIQAMKEIPAAKPSRPSIRFTIFVNPTIQKIVNGAAQYLRYTTPPQGRLIKSTRIS